MKTKILIVLILLGLAVSIRLEAQEIEIFSEDFENKLESWNLESGWEVIIKEGSKVLQGTQHTFAKVYLAGKPITLEARVKILKGTLHISFRTNEMTDGQTRYFLGLNEFNSYLQKEVKLNFQGLAQGPRGISLGNWHQIKIEIKDKKIKVLVDKNLLFEVEDKNIIGEGNISFETLENSLAYIDDVRAEVTIPEVRQINSSDIFPGGEHKGDITLEAGDLLILENGKFNQFGNIYLKDRAKLVIKNSQLTISRYEKLLNHWGIELSDNSALEVLNSKLLPGPESLFIINGRDNSRVKMKDSPTKIHLFQFFGRAKAEVDNSEIIGEIGGLVGAGDSAEVKINNSKIGAVNLYIPKDAVFEATGLGTGFFKDWNLQHDTKASGINYNVILENTELIPDGLGPGPFERGWPVFIDSGAKVKIKDSELRKVVIELHGEKAEFSNFVVEKPTNFEYREIKLENVKIMGQWGIFLHGSSDVVVRGSEEFWTFIYDDSRLKLVNTHMDEFDPRNFRGEIIFENSRWDTAAEIIINNDFKMSGSLEIGQIGGFSWLDSKVTRIYEVVGKPDAKLTLVKNGETLWSGTADEEGKTSFSIKFDDNTFNDAFALQDNLGRQQEVTFFSKTPIDMEQGFISKFIQRIKLKVPPIGLSQGKVIFLLPPLIIILLFLVLFFYLRKKRRQRYE